MNVTQWDIFIALDFFWGGIGVGAYIFSIFYKKRNAQLSRIAAYASPVCFILAMIFLWAHLGQPLKGIWILLSFNFTSTLAWGSLLQGIFCIISVAYALRVYKNSKLTTGSDQFPETKLGYIGLPFAVLVGIYHGYLLGSLTGRPGWNTGLMSILSIAALIITGIALVLLISRLFAKTGEIDNDWQSPYKILISTIVIQLFVVFLWIRTLIWGGVEKKEAALSILSNHTISFWVMAILIGLVIPIVLGIKDLNTLRKTGNLKLTTPVITLSLVLIGAFFLRYVIILAGQ